jgi:hypothetical protein
VRIVGNGAGKPVGAEIDSPCSTWSQDEIKGLKKEGCDISEQDATDIMRDDLSECLFRRK